LPDEHTHLAFEHDTFLVPFGEHPHVIRFCNDLQADSDRASRVRRRQEHPN